MRSPPTTPKRWPRCSRRARSPRPTAGWTSCASSSTGTRPRGSSASRARAKRKPRCRKASSCAAQYDFHAIRSDELGLGPFTDNYIDFTVSDGSIVAVSEQAAFMTNGFSDLVWTPFSAWVVQNHPEDGPLLYLNWPTNTSERISEESIPVWDRLTREVRGRQSRRVRRPPTGRCRRQRAGVRSDRQDLRMVPGPRRKRTERCGSAPRKCVCTTTVG